MLRLISRCVMVLMTWLLCQGALCDAAPIVPGLTTFYGRAIQDVRVLGGTPINPGPEFVIDDLFGDGYIIIDRQAQVGNSISFPVYLGTQLVGYSSDRRIELRAVPEPSSMVLLGIGGLALVGYQLRRRKVNVKSIRDR